MDAIGNTTEGWLIDDVVVRQFFTAANPDVKLTAGAAATLDVSGIGDFSGDGVADFGVLQKSATDEVNISLIEGSASGAPAVNGALSAAADTVFAFNTDDSGSRGLQLSGGGDVDHDGADELLITSTTASRVVFGGDVAAANPVNLDAFATADPGRVLQLQGGSLTALGDVNGDGFDDLGATVLVKTPRLVEIFQSELTAFNYRPVGQVFMGAARAGFDLDAPDLVFESASPTTSCRSCRAPSAPAASIICSTALAT